MADDEAVVKAAEGREAQQASQPPETVKAAEGREAQDILSNEAVKAAIAQAKREAQAEQGKDKAKIHAAYQARIRELENMAVERLKAAGDENAEQWREYNTLRGKAQEYDNLAAQRAAEEQWRTWSQETAQAYGLEASDPRLKDPESAADFVAKCKEAMKEDAASERQRLIKEAKDNERQALDGKIENGDLDVLEGRTAGRPGNDLSKYTINDSRALYRLAAQQREKRRR